MEISEIILEAINTLKVNKMRTALAVLGIVIGIGSVIALVSLGQASQKSITNQIQSLGSNLLTITPTNAQSGNVRSAGAVTTLTYEDAKAILSSPSVNTVSKASPEISKRSQVVTGKNNTNTQVYGVTPVYSEVKKVEEVKVVEEKQPVVEEIKEEVKEEVFEEAKVAHVEVKSEPVVEEKKLEEVLSEKTMERINKHKQWGKKRVASDRSRLDK